MNWEELRQQIVKIKEQIKDKLTEHIVLKYSDSQYVIDYNFNKKYTKTEFNKYIKNKPEHKFFIIVLSTDPYIEIQNKKGIQVINPEENIVNVF